MKDSGKKKKIKQKEMSKSVLCLGLPENRVGKEQRWSAKAGSSFCVNLKSKTPLTKRASSTSSKWSSCCPDRAELSRACRNSLCGWGTKCVPHWTHTLSSRLTFSLWSDRGWGQCGQATQEEQFWGEYTTQTHPESTGYLVQIIYCLGGFDPNHVFCFFPN